MKNSKNENEIRSRVENLPGWKKEWVKEAASPELREHFFAVTKPKWKEIEQRMKDVQQQAAVDAGFRDYAEVKRHLEWTRFGTPETEELERRVKAVEQAAEPQLVALMKERNAVGAQQEVLEYHLAAQKADMLEKYTLHAISNVKQIVANGRLLLECDIDGISKGMMALVPEDMAKALKNGISKQEVAAQLFSGDLLILDKYRSLVLENGQVVGGFVNNRMGPNHYDHQYEMQMVNGQRVILNKVPDNYDSAITLFTDTPISFNGEKTMKVEYMRPAVELERARLSEIQVTTSGTPYIRCKVDDVQQMRIRMDDGDKALYNNTKTLWGIKAAAELTKVFAEKYYADTLSQELNKTIKR